MIHATVRSSKAPRRVIPVRFGMALPVLCIACSATADRMPDAATHEVSLPPGRLGDTPAERWTAIEPAPGRWNRSRLDTALAMADSVGSGALLVVDDGAVVAHTGAIAETYQVASVRKSLLSVLIGIAVDRGQLDLDATLRDLDIDDLPPSLTDRERSATVRQLITARSGVYHVAAYEPASMADRRPARGSHAPGEFWFYNNWDFNTLGTIYRRAAGLDVFEGFRRHLAQPLSLEDFDPDGQTWVDHPKSEHPAYVFRISARDLARIGLLMSRGGVWDTERIVSDGWVRESTAPFGTEAWPGAGYGYMWWAPVEGRHYPGVRLPAGAFIARGNGPHHMLIAPSLDLVVVHAAETNRPRPSRWVDGDDVARMFGLILEARGFDSLP